MYMRPGELTVVQVWEQMGEWVTGCVGTSHWSDSRLQIGGAALVARAFCLGSGTGSSLGSFERGTGSSGCSARGIGSVCSGLGGGGCRSIGLALAIVHALPGLDGGLLCQGTCEGRCGLWYRCT